MKRTDEDEIVMLKYLGRMYRKYMNHASCRMEEVAEDEGAYYSEEFMIDMSRILRELPMMYAEIIRRDFLLDNEQDWWQNKYNADTYKQLKNMAVKAFFHCLYV